MKYLRFFSAEGMIGVLVLTLLAAALGVLYFGAPSLFRLTEEPAVTRAPQAVRPHSAVKGPSEPEDVFAVFTRADVNALSIRFPPLRNLRFSLLFGDFLEVLENSPCMDSAIAEGFIRLIEDAPPLSDEMNQRMTEFVAACRQGAFAWAIGGAGPVADVDAQTESYREQILPAVCRFDAELSRLLQLAVVRRTQFAADCDSWIAIQEKSHHLVPDFQVMAASIALLDEQLEDLFAAIDRCPKEKEPLLQQTLLTDLKRRFVRVKSDYAALEKQLHALQIKMALLAPAGMTDYAAFAVGKAALQADRHALRILRSWIAFRNMIQGRAAEYAARIPQTTPLISEADLDTFFAPEPMASADVAPACLQMNQRFFYQVERIKDRLVFVENALNALGHNAMPDAPSSFGLQYTESPRAVDLALRVRNARDGFPVFHAEINGSSVRNRLASDLFLFGIEPDSSYTLVISAKGFVSQTVQLDLQTDDSLSRTKERVIELIPAPKSFRR